MQHVAIKATVSGQLGDMDHLDKSLTLASVTVVHSTARAQEWS